MAIILFHSSKTMRRRRSESIPYRAPQLLPAAQTLATYVQSLNTQQLGTSMHLSPTMSSKTYELMQAWDADPAHQLPAIDAFLGDMYSGLRIEEFSETDRAYADNHLFILSGLYGALRPLDSIAPYRLEMGYRFPDEPFENLYTYWGESIAQILPDDDTIYNLSSVEYTKAVLPHLQGKTVITPKFLTIDPKSGEPKNVVVHAKIARGAYVRWLIQNQISRPETSNSFDLLGYTYDAKLSTLSQPVYICDTFRGLGLSIRETKLRLP